ncbi:hypothetical protein CJ738_31890, partial [Klebsiella pneumoniae]
NSRTASRFALRPKVKQEHNEADGGAHGLSASVSAADKPASASAGVGAKPDQSRSDSGCILA